MKLEGTRSQETKSVLTAETKSPQNSESNSLEQANIDANAGSASKLGEFYNQSSRLKQNFFAKLQTGTQASGFGAEATVTKTGDKVTIETTKKDDKIGITQDAAGNVTVEVNGKKQTFTGKDKDNLIIKAGDGNDTVTVGKGVTVKLTIDGGDGDDRLQGGDGDDTISGGGGGDKIEAGAGNDTVDGGDGRDYINGSKGRDKLAGGAGNDVIYGGDDADEIDGGDGDDYLEGGKGNDTIAGGKGKDILSGGMNDDILKGGEGDDVIYAGEGKDSIFGEKGSNKIFSQTGDTDDSKTKGVKNTVVTIDLSKAVGTNIVVNGLDEFKERVEADLEMLRSSSTGRKMLEAHDNSKHSVTIVEETTINKGNSASSTGAGNPFYDEANKKNGSGQDGVVKYEIASVYRATSERPPVVGLFHELAHTYDFTNGTGRKGIYDGKDKVDKIDTLKNPLNKKPDVVNLERVGTGLTVDHDNDVKTPEILDPNHPQDLTENGLRNELSLPKREHYRES